MELSPFLYHGIIRPKWITSQYIHKKIRNFIDLDDQRILDFGAGTGANCLLGKPGKYVGVDPDEKRINFAKRVYPDYDFEILEGEKLPFPDVSVDIILIIAVLHHIPPDEIKIYMKEFRRVLQEASGKILVIEPCFFEKTRLNNWFMKKNDNGAYIQDEHGYFKYFQEAGFNCTPIKKYRKCFFYNELFFLATIR
ncbi:class I SAM-dependent methyltransferase [Bacillus sp. T33-2]|uniref:class I SAM-dependent methyltransferase n=1 Tax=Bacillus sp. T33-2 TaxID=2054168 RepID=UPI000C791AF1|nr:class I SAM-dependent methyltransferase [Bacillus sp. T33-2]PLR95044.1 class I SAM-dependent methyltransferase [Bacillus sp. T33-2]